MARRKKKSGGEASAAWLVTFSDLMTLLLTFFVLLLSMSSMDRTLVSTISASVGRPALIEHSGRGRVSTRIELLAQLIKDPANIMQQQDRIKDLLFPDEVLPPEITRGTLEENLRVLSNPQGVVIVLTDGILFAPGSYRLNAAGTQLMEALVPFLHHVTGDVNISGHTDTTTSQKMDNYTLSAMRAQSVLAIFLKNQIKPTRFSLSAFGPDRPLTFGSSAADMAQNRRVEIFIKNQQWMGVYP